ncbi:zinc finger MYND domain-containing protein [Aspergillus aculeatinus CBS 121060]|uniref:Uncharacterized protein n=1 Tax=Aspergillus aculeatinus CBS 121060 TaxID=1448322 RepID=A0ACD1GSU2_9EURO|nr:hypothetical protein BO66DRAFT_464706 [Aspergillus aculeatinus CBS 121060]RAH64400.1 hypothetical protein BO66DRAFT_464706 [Aspergillus aculeatinus CBS 121060]
MSGCILTPMSCGECHRENSQIRCNRCKVMFYCSEEHRVSHRRQHETFCDIVARHRADVKAAEAELRALVASGEDPFVDQDFPIPRNGQGEGLQGAVMDVRSARLDLLRALVFIRSLEARTETLAHSLGLIRGPKWTRGEIRCTAAVMLDLGMDQECWDLLQWWGKANGQPDVDQLSIVSPSLPILKFPRGVSVMEPIAGDSHWMIFDCVAPYLLLLKVQALLDLTRLSLCTPAFADKVPREIFDGIRGYIPVSPGVINHPDLRGKLTYTNEIKQLTRQIETLWDEVGVGPMGEISDVLYKDEDWHMHRWNDGGQPLSPCLNCLFRRDPEAVAYIRSFIYRDVVKKPW